jgi:enterochelin esterase-like enzyme
MIVIMGVHMVGHGANLGPAYRLDKPCFMQKSDWTESTNRFEWSGESEMREDYRTGRAAAVMVLAASLFCAPAVAAGEASISTVKVRSTALVGNLEGNSPERDVIVVLPPSYGTDKARRYPVIYFLHGYLATSKAYDDMVKYGAAMTEAAGRGQEFILIAPDSMTKYGGAMYSDSPTVGNFEGFIARDLVAYVDKAYRTLAKPEARGLAGHSMGGYGTLKIAMKYPGIFSSIYAMSSCCLSARPVNAEQDKRLESITPEEAAKADFGTRSTFAAASAWSPDPTVPGFFFRLGTRDGAVQPDVIANWAANAPHAMLPQFLPSLRGLKAIGLEVGDKDFLIEDNKTIHALLEKFGIRHEWAIYDGDHGNRIPARFRTNMLPFFAANLAMR